MRRNPMSGLLACAIALPGIAGQPLATTADTVEELMTMRVEGSIAVDAQGNVLAHQVDTKLDPKMQGLVEEAVKTWSFMPPMVDGKPATAKSDMRITLAGRKIADGYEVRIDNVLFYDAREEEMALKRAVPVDAPGPKEPRVALSIVRMYPRVKYPRDFYVNARVTIQILANPDGTVAQAHASQCSLYFARGTQAQLRSACRTMEESAVKAIRNWKLKVDTHGKQAPTLADLTGVLPLQYTMPGDGARIAASSEPGQWRPEARTRYREGEWLRNDRFAQRVGTSDTKANEWMPATSPLRFRDGSGPERAL